MAPPLVAASTPQVGHFAAMGAGPRAAAGASPRGVVAEVHAGGCSRRGPEASFHDACHMGQNEPCFGHGLRKWWHLEQRPRRLDS